MGVILKSLSKATILTVISINTLMFNLTSIKSRLFNLLIFYLSLFNNRNVLITTLNSTYDIYIIFTIYFNKKNSTTNAQTK